MNPRSGEAATGCVSNPLQTTKFDYPPFTRGSIHAKIIIVQNNKANHMQYTFDYHRQLAELVRETVGLRYGAEEETSYRVNLNGLTRHNFTLRVIYAAQNDQWRLRIMHNSSRRKAKNELLLETMSDLPFFEGSEFVRNESAARPQFEYTTSNPDLLLEQAAALRDYLEDNELGHGSVATEDKIGVSFAGTNFEGWKERDFMATLCQIQRLGYDVFFPGVGRNLQIEYVLKATGSRVDAVEFNEEGAIISIIECQSGIYDGDQLDNDHMCRALCQYLYDPEVIGTVRKVVLLAGAYREGDLRVLQERAYELARREQPIELIVLVTVKNGDRIGVESLVL